MGGTPSLGSRNRMAGPRFETPRSTGTTFASCPMANASVSTALTSGITFLIHLEIATASTSSVSRGSPWREGCCGAACDAGCEEGCDAGCEEGCDAGCEDGCGESCEDGCMTCVLWRRLNALCVVQTISEVSCKFFFLI